MKTNKPYLEERGGAKVLRIKSLIVVSSVANKEYIVGLTKVNGVVVDEIKDASCEWENGTDFIYQIYGNGKPLAEVINCPVNIEFFVD